MFTYGPPSALGKITARNFYKFFKPKKGLNVISCSTSHKKLKGMHVEKQPKKEAAEFVLIRPLNVQLVSVSFLDVASYILQPILRGIRCREVNRIYPKKLNLSEIL